MKKIFSLLLIFTFFVFNIFSKDSNFIGISFFSGVLNGYINEYVFDEDCKNTDNKLSQLDWELKNIPYVGVKMNMNFSSHIFMNGDFAFSPITRQSGYMRDYDWQNSFVNAWKNDDPTELTNFSESMNYLNQYLNANLKLGWKFYLPMYISISPMIKFQAATITFDGFGGYRTYKNENWNRIDWDDDDKVISYKQLEKSIALGMNLNIVLLKKLELSASAYYSPFFSKIDAYDFHWKTHTVYNDLIYNFWQVQGDFSAFYYFNSKNKAGVNVACQYIPLWKGADQASNINSKNEITGNWIVFPKTLGGTSRFIYDISLSFTHNF